MTSQPALSTEVEFSISNGQYPEATGLHVITDEDENVAKIERNFTQQENDLIVEESYYWNGEEVRTETEEYEIIDDKYGFLATEDVTSITFVGTVFELHHKGERNCDAESVLTSNFAAKVDQKTTA